MQALYCRCPVQAILPRQVALQRRRIACAGRGAQCIRALGPASSCRLEHETKETHDGKVEQMTVTGLEARARVGSRGCEWPHALTKTPHGGTPVEGGA